MKRLTPTLLLIAVGVLGMTAAIPQQDEGANQGRDGAFVAQNREPRAVETITLENAVAEDVAAAVRVAFGDRLVDSVAIKSQNAVLIKGPESVLAEAHDMIQMLDVRAQRQESERKVVIYDVRDLIDQASLRQFASIIVDGPGERFAFEDNGMLIVSAMTETQEQLESLLAEVRKHAAGQPRATDGDDRRVQLIWLLSGLETSVAKAAPDIMKPVMDELASLGFTDLKVAVNSVVEATVSEHFSIESLIELDETVRFRAEGLLHLENDRPRLHIDVEAQASAPRSVQPSRVPTQTFYAAVETTVITRDGHYVILSAAPTSGRQSVFVLRVTTTD